MSGLSHDPCTGCAWKQIKILVTVDQKLYTNTIGLRSFTQKMLERPVLSMFSCFRLISLEQGYILLIRRGKERFEEKYVSRKSIFEEKYFRGKVLSRKSIFEEKYFRGKNVSRKSTCRGKRLPPYVCICICRNGCLRSRLLLISSSAVLQMGYECRLDHKSMTKVFI